MKKIFHIALMAVCGVALTLTSCRDDADFTESIFDTTTPDVDPSLATYPFDLWLQETFVEPYNTTISYRFNFPSSNMDYQLSPAGYEESQVLSHLLQYLFYDVYKERVGEKFLRQYGPRMYQYVGSVEVNASTGTEILGYASGGIKITLTNVNNVKTTANWTPNDMLFANRYFFHTLHHEFSHILHQTRLMPVAYRQVTPGSYDGRDWQKRDSVTTHTLGYVTHYASSAYTEDFVEVLSCIITDTDDTWMTRIVDACLNGVREGDKERIWTLIDSLHIEDIDDPSKRWNNITLLRELDADNDNAYVRTITRWLQNGNDNAYNTYRSEGNYKYEADKSYTSFRDFMNDVAISNSDTLAGMSSILNKIDIATEWYTDQWGLYIYSMRDEVDRRQKDLNDFLKTITLYTLDGEEKKLQ